MARHNCFLAIVFPVLKNNLSQKIDFIFLSFLCLNKFALEGRHTL